MANEIELYSKLNDPLAAIEKLGGFFARSGLFGCEKQEQGMVLAMVCLAERRSPVDLLRTYHIVDGNLSKKALAALAEFNGMGGKHKWIEPGDTPNPDHAKWRAVLQLTHQGDTVTYSYSMADAAQEKLVRAGSRWEKRPGNMLRARCISNGLGMLCPGIFAGSDGDSEPAPTGELNLATATPAPEVKAAVVAEVKTVEAEVVSDEKAEAAMGLAPALAPEPATPTPSNILPLELCEKVATSIGGDYMVEALAWMRADNQKWLGATQGLANLAEARAKRICNQTQGFRRAICTHVRGESGAAALACKRCGAPMPQEGAK